MYIEGSQEKAANGPISFTWGFFLVSSHWTMMDIENNNLPKSLGFPGGSLVKNLPANAGDAGSIPGLGRSPGEGNGNPLQYPCLENPMDRGAWRATVH